jgi:hypothetical protein
MPKEETFYEFVKALFRISHRQLTELTAVQCVLAQEYGPGFRKRVDEWIEKIEASPEEKDFRDWIDRLDLLEILAAFESYRGPIQ